LIWEEVATNIKETSIQYTSISFLNEQIDKQLKRIMEKCLEKDPVKRYQDAGEILRDFEETIIQEN
jgi:serine/threonine protein kinase